MLLLVTIKLNNEKIIIRVHISPMQKSYQYISNTRDSHDNSPQYISNNRDSHANSPLYISNNKISYHNSPQSIIMQKSSP